MPEKTAQVDKRATVDAQMKRINDARTKIDGLKAERQRLQGRLEAEQKSLAELAAKSKDEFGVEPDGLPALAKKLRAEAEAECAKAEAILKGDAA